MVELKKELVISTLPVLAAFSTLLHYASVFRITGIVFFTLVSAHSIKSILNIKFNTFKYIP